MRTPLFVSCLVVVAACGGGGSDDNKVDAAVIVDSKPIDAAPIGVTGLGQKCTGDAECPANAPVCIGVAGGPMVRFCTPKCLTGGAGTWTGDTFMPLMPAPTLAACTNAYTGSVGQGACGVILATTPNDNPLVVNKMYTGIELGCVVLCGANMACPTGMTPVGSGQNCVCFPQ